MSLFIENVKKLSPKFENARVESVTYEVKSKRLSLVLLLCVHFEQEDIALVRDYVAKNLPFAGVDVQFKKTVCACDVVSKRIISFIGEEYRAVKGRISAEDISVKNEDGSVYVTIGAEKEVCEHLKSSNFAEKMDKYLANYFCEKFHYSYLPKQDEDGSAVLLDEKVDYTRIEQIPARYFKVNYVTRLFDNNDTDEVMYIQDAAERTGELAIAGKIIGIRQKETKKGKPFYIIDFNDGTGRMSGTVFSTKEIIKKMEKVQEGSEMVAVGKAEVTNGYHRFTISSLNFCELPKDFVYQEKASRKPPESYLIVHPDEVEQIVQTDMFSMVNFIPECLKGKTFVVIDIETTGTMPQDDKITEIGAVKVVDGNIVQKFATMVNPERKIPENIVELTGITDEMVADAPTFSEIAGDLYKFCHGSIIIAHNLPFDYTFIKNASKPLNYVYTNHGIDTVGFSRRVLPGLNNHKLNTVCEHFGIEFLHHRAYSDALATAQMFIQLVRLNGSLPDFDA